MKTLYLGLDPTGFERDNLVHFPVIEIHPINADVTPVKDYSHLIFTSKTAVRIFFDLCNVSLEGKSFFAVGPGTASELKKRGCEAKVAEESTQEGMIRLIKQEKTSFFFPKSSRAREKLPQYLRENTQCHIVDIYDTKVKKQEPIDLEEFSEIVFTSASCVDGFLEIFGEIPKGKKLTCIGPITEEKLFKVRLLFPSHLLEGE